MLNKGKATKSINFLQPVGGSDTVVKTSFYWLTTVGKTFLMIVQAVVLGAFVFRFIKDQQNNDLTKEINDSVKVLENETWKENARKYENLQTLLGDIEEASENQDLNSNLISEIISGVPPTLNVENISIKGKQISISLNTIDFGSLKNYEESLKNNSSYDEVKFQVEVVDGEWNVNLTFIVADQEE